MPNEWRFVRYYTYTVSISVFIYTAAIREPRGFDERRNDVEMTRDFIHNIMLVRNCIPAVLPCLSATVVFAVENSKRRTYPNAIICAVNAGGGHLVCTRARRFIFAPASCISSGAFKTHLVILSRAIIKI